MALYVFVWNQGSKFTKDPLLNTNRKMAPWGVLGCFPSYKKRGGDPA